MSCNEFEKEEEWMISIIDDPDGEVYYLYNFIEENSFKKPMSRLLADKIRDHITETFLDFYGGYMIWEEVSFIVKNETYSVIAVGMPSEEQTKIDYMIFVKEKEE